MPGGAQAEGQAAGLHGLALAREGLLHLAARARHDRDLGQSAQDLVDLRLAFLDLGRLLLLLGDVARLVHALGHLLVEGQAFALTGKLVLQGPRGLDRGQDIADRDHAAYRDDACDLTRSGKLQHESGQGRDRGSAGVKAIHGFRRRIQGAHLDTRRLARGKEERQRDGEHGRGGEHAERPEDEEPTALAPAQGDPLGGEQGAQGGRRGRHVGRRNRARGWRLGWRR